MKFYKYHGAGNDFLVADNRDGKYNLTQAQISLLCDRHVGLGADGLMLLEESKKAKFKMLYYNSDGSGGMMCGNGGRCIVAFASDLGYDKFDFEASDGFHTAELIKSEPKKKIIRLKMIDIPNYGIKNDDTYFINTGTYHFVKFIENIETYPVVEEGRIIRYSEDFAPVGTNVDFVEYKNDSLIVRTYEKGVEDETLACGTGIVASALAAYAKQIPSEQVDNRVKYNLNARISSLSVDFIPSYSGGFYSASDVWLTGPAEFVAEIEISL